MQIYRKKSQKILDNFLSVGNGSTKVRKCYKY